MRLTVVGSGSAWSTVGGNACYALDGRLLVDCGSPAHLLLPRYGLDLGDVETVLLTHFHADHTCMLPLMLGGRAFDPRGTRPLRLAGPVGTREYVLRLVQTGYGSQLREAIAERLVLDHVVLQDGSDVDIGGYRVRAHAVVHSLGPSLAYAITGPDGATCGFSGDTTLCAGLRRAAAASDLMVCECTGWDGPVTSHLWRGEVEELMRECPTTTFLVSHLAERRRLPGALVAHDGLGVDITPPGTPLPQPPESLQARAG